MQIDAIPEWSLTPRDDHEIAALLGRCFATDFGGRSFFMQRQHLRLVTRDTRIIGHMALTLRAIRLGDDLVTIAGLADVATDPDHRGKGIAAALLTRAIAEARESPAQFLLLFGTAGLYAAAGCRPVTNTLTAVDMTGAWTGRVIHPGKTHLMVLPLRDMAWDENLHVDLLGTQF